MFRGTGNRRLFLKQVFGALCGSILPLCAEPKEERQKIRVKTKFYSCEHISCKFSKVSDFWDRYDLGGQEKQLSLLKKKFPHRRLSSELCPETNFPIYVNEYDSLDIYLAHIEAISLHAGLRVKKVNPFKYIIYHLEINAVDEIMFVS